MNRGLWRLLIVVGLLAWFIFILRVAQWVPNLLSWEVIE